MRVVPISVAVLAAAIVSIPVAWGLSTIALAPTTAAKPEFYRPGQSVVLDLRFAGQPFRVEAVIDRVERPQTVNRLAKSDRLDEQDVCGCGHEEPPTLSMR